MESFISKRNVGLIVFVISLVVVLASLMIPRGPTPLQSNAPEHEYSSARAWQHLEVIGENSSALGTDGNNEVRQYIYDYLVRLGVETEIQSTTAYSPTWRTAGRINNVLARIPGNDSSFTIGIVANFDTPHNVPGASNAKSGIVTMLEVARILQNNSQLKNDVILLFVDGGEVGLLGAQAFIDNHVWAEKLDLIVSVSARGSSGPVRLTETSRNNGWLIQQFGAAVSNPVASSLTNSINRMVLNDTSFFVFQQAGIPSFSLAHSENPRIYQTVLDNMENFDSRSLQHQGEYILDLVDHFGNLEVVKEASTDRVYFDLFGKLFVDYPLSWVPNLLTGVIILFGFTVWYGIKYRQTSLKGIVLGFFVFVGIGVVCALTLAVLTNMVNSGHALYQYVPLHNDLIYLIAAVALITIIFVAVFHLAFRKIKYFDLILGTQSGWLLITTLVSLLIPGSNYLLIWPLISSLFLTLIFLRWDELSWIIKTIFLVLAGLPVLILWPPVMKGLYLMLGLRLMWLVAGIVVLFLGILLPQVSAIREWNKFLLPVASLLVFCVALGVIIVNGGINQDNPGMNSLLYHIDYDQGQGYWLSIDEEPDEYVAQVIDEPFMLSNLGEFIPYENMPVLVKEAEVVGSNPINIVMLEEKLNEEQRLLEIEISAAEHVNNVIIFMDPEQVSGDVMLNRELVVDVDEYWPIIRYYNLPETGITLSIPVKLESDFLLQVVSQSYDFLAEVNEKLEPRPDYLISAPTGITDSTFTFSTHQF